MQEPRIQSDARRAIDRTAPLARVIIQPLPAAADLPMLLLKS